jgi:hypothetical protein
MPEPADHKHMAVSTSAVMLAVGLGSGLVGAATATDMVSLRALAHSVDVPIVSALVIGLREAMPTTLAHALEPALGVVGGLVVASTLVRPARARAGVVAWWRAGAQRTALAFSLLRTG